jgi:DNA replication and repair protein RecF
MITDIHLQHFRSYTDASFELSPNVNIVVGPNASGKTNLLEAILISSKGSSYRAKDIDLVEFNNEWARIEANYNNLNRIVKLQKNNFDKIDKSYEINTNKTKRLNLAQTIPVVLFEPNHLFLLIGSPELRRNFLDDTLEQTVLGYKTLKGQYKRALTQRNVLLKRDASKNPEVFVWNVRLSELGGRIFRERSALVEKMGKEIDGLYGSLSGGSEKIKLEYKTNISTVNYETDLLQKLEQSASSDMLKGFTTYGPHRDDLQIMINDRLGGEVASRGETRTILLALKVIETQVIEEARGQKPLLLFDDVFSELDGARRLALTKILGGYQTIITTTDADVVVQHFMDSNNIIPLEK